MDRLLALIDQSRKEDEDWGQLRLYGATWSGRELCLDVFVNVYSSGAEDTWKVYCSQVVDERLMFDFDNDLDFSADSPLLLPYKDPYIQINFNDNFLSPNELFGIVASTCYEFLGASTDIAKFINLSPTSAGICSSKFGMLGNFPKPIAESLLGKLSKCDIKLYWSRAHLQAVHYGNYPAEERADMYFPTMQLRAVSDTSELRALRIGRSYVIASKFRAEHCVGV